MEERRKLRVVIIVVVMILSAWAVYTIYSLSRPSSQYLDYRSDVTRICIDGNENLTSENGVVSGGGSLSDPYVLTFPDADRYYNQTIIEISNTSVAFVLRGSVFSYSYLSGCLYVSEVSVRISNATGFSVEDNHIGGGLKLNGCSDFTFCGNSLPSDYGDTIVNCSRYALNGNTGGKVSMVGCADFSISGNVNMTIALNDCSYSAITNNRFERGVITVGNSLDCLIDSNLCQSITINAGSADCLVVNNSVRDYSVSGGRGIVLDCVHNVTIYRNEIQNCSHHGIELWKSVTNCTIARNNISDCYGAIILRDAEGCEVYHNDIFSARSDNPTLDEQGWLNSWDLGYPGGGNYYFDYEGEDTHSGPDQTEDGPDGIGDTPVVVYTYLPGDPGVDRYPLMLPYVG